MNEHETIDLLRYRQDTARIAYNQDTIAHWQHALADVTLDNARTAMRDLMATGERDVSVPRIHAWLRNHAHRVHTDPLGATDCALCDATGFVPGDDGRYRRCPCCAVSA